ncbi:MAG: hypothetical protein ACQSGP_01250, partial [Frankia sp.]
HHRDRLAEDHRRAARLARTLADAAPGAVDPATVETNMILVQVADAPALVAAAARRAVLVSATGPRRVRIVTHLDVDDAAADYAGDVLADLLAAGGEALTAAIGRPGRPAPRAGVAGEPAP